jgi:hypothetical protein
MRPLISDLTVISIFSDEAERSRMHKDFASSHLANKAGSQNAGPDPGKALSFQHATQSSPPHSNGISQTIHTAKSEKIDIGLSGRRIPGNSGSAV